MQNQQEKREQSDKDFQTGLDHDLQHGPGVGGHVEWGLADSSVHQMPKDKQPQLQMQMRGQQQQQQQHETPTDNKRASGL